MVEEGGRGRGYVLVKAEEEALASEGWRLF